MTVEIRPLDPVGAVVTGLQPGGEEEPVVRDALYSAWLQYGLLLFRNISSTTRHLALSRCFGDLEVHPFAESRSDENEALIEIGGRNTGKPYLFDENDVRMNRLGWHRDTAYTPFICKGAMLRMVVPSLDHGETLVADTAAAYDDLANEMKERIEDLEYKASLRIGPIEQSGPGALWKTVREASDPAASVAERYDARQAQARYPSVVHPVVLVHPESERRCIMLSPTYVDFFLNLPSQESDELLESLCRHMTKAPYVYKHKWSSDDALLWDNRRMMHASAGIAVGDTRRGLRTTLAGNLSCGRYFDTNAEGCRPPYVD